MSADEHVPNIMMDDADSGFDDGTTSLTASRLKAQSRRELAKMIKRNAESDPENDVTCELE
jgi:hypothetical protein